MQALNPHKHDSRLVFCRWFLHNDAEDPHFLDNVIFADEAGFTRNGEGVYAIIESGYQTHVSLYI